MLNKIKAIFNPNTCLSCGHDKISSRVTNTINHITCEEEYVCDNCGKVQGYWAYGSFNDPLFYMDTKWKRFKYLFLGVY